MILKNVKATTSVDAILKALDPFAYLDERNVRLVKAKPPGAKCFCFVDMDSHEVPTLSSMHGPSVHSVTIFSLKQEAPAFVAASNPSGWTSHQTQTSVHWRSQSLRRGGQTFEESKVSFLLWPSGYPFWLVTPVIVPVSVSGGMETDPTVPCWVTPLTAPWWGWAPIWDVLTDALFWSLKLSLVFLVAASPVPTLSAFLAATQWWPTRIAR